MGDDLKPVLLAPLTFGLSCALLGSGCTPSSDVWRDHVAGSYYLWAADSPHQTHFVEEDSKGGLTMTGRNPVVIVEAPVTRAVWDSRCVLVEQSRSRNYIFDMTQKHLHGPYSRSQFADHRKKLGVPAHLQFTKEYIPQKAHGS